MTELSRIVLASNNPGKLKEFAALFAPLNIELLPQSQFGVPEADEPYVTFIENALGKARHASEHTGLPALADDSGLIVPALDGAPGVLSARYATLFGQSRSDANNNQCLQAQLKGISDRAAAYIAVLVLVRHPKDPAPIIAQALWHGEIIDQAMGEHGFGYDPYFWVPAYQQTAAQMAPELKNRISHRGQALQALCQQLASTT
ncbi:RdgB/HAM1 family non-canonical purine NTP pyrophosphatase [Brackiella oedipodis]|uniref:RdgB/HAM1 family non-canonical purine NTP pyrophosphatase n=1 Tax=Brackiella oedipodis TaxID=124225 RepID=UPI00048B167A|nr:RdgB/HAM1 family non-canonical purine NTP pyrophosphatase [Brackiella oedipodis]